ncbi:glutathione synthetase [Sphingomonas cavernae]|uniref:Glutathione synthetase n=1 Tax=Sphingomonas cavernae TaxID=2320861 RepID=A0A418W876_9SPHN|nr:glutathione synthetase [Sphingomonas cavernae]RJF86206.1 glutathione synthase [Sphingomonas cavernae]
MLIAFFVNDMDREHAGFTTTVLAHEATRRGHRVCYVTPGDFMLNPQDELHVHARFAPQKKARTAAEFFKNMQAVDHDAVTIDVREIDVLMLRSDPSLDAQARPWSEDVGIIFGRAAAERGVLVLNDPDSLSLAINKLYFQSFPEAVRADTLITKFASDVKAFAKDHGGKIILKPLQGSGGQSVFLVGSENASNMNQMIEAITRDGYIIAQAYVPAAAKGDIRLFLMNGRPLQIGKKFAALRRVSSKDDIRSNIHAGGKAEAVDITDKELRVAELIRPKLMADGMFLVGIDIVGDKILEVNVFSPGNLQSCSKLAGVNFATPIIAAIERKIEIAAEFAGAFDNRALAVM